MHPEFEQYVRARSGPLVGFAYLLCRDRHLAEDLVQEVLAKACHRWDRIEAENPDAYLRRAVVWAHSSWWRRLSHRERPLETVEETADSDDFAQRHAVRDELWVLLGTLPRRQRTVLMLRFFEDLDDERIAELMDCSPATVRVHAHRALAALRDRFSAPVPVPAGERTFAGVPVGAVRRRAAGMRVRRRATAAATAVAVLVALIVLTPVWRGPQPPPVVTPPPTPAVSASPSATAASALVPRPATEPLPVFPYQPGFVPVQAGSLQVVAGLDMTGLESLGNPGRLLIYAGSAPYDWDWEAAETRSTRVNGQPATLRTGTDENGALQVGLTWQRDGRWVTVQGFGSLLSVAEVERVARELRPGSVTATPQITYTLMPDGYEVNSLNAGYVCMSREPRLTYQDPEGVCISVGADTGLVSQGSSLTVGGRPAQLLLGPINQPTELRVLLDERRVMVISQSLRDLSEADLIRFAESITVAGPQG